MKRIIFLIGAGGCGKGTHGKAIAMARGLAYLSSGEALREMKYDTSSGQLSPDDLVLGFTKEFILRNADRDIVLDGVPRNEAQARELLRFLAELGRRIHMVIWTNTPESCNERVSSNPRPGRTEDTQPAVLQNRVMEFKNSTVPMLEYLKPRVQWAEVNTEGRSIEESRPDVVVAFQFPAPMRTLVHAAPAMVCSGH